LFHILGWLGFLTLLLFVFPIPRLDVSSEYMDMIAFIFMMVNLTLILFFYLNYYMLLPKLWFRKKKWTYVIMIILSGSVYSILPQFYLPKYTELEQLLDKKIAFVGLGPGFILFVIVFIASCGFRYSYELKVSEISRRRSENQHLNSELSFLKSQINPHFLFNTLNTLYGLTVSKSDIAPDVVLRLSSLMRYSIREVHEELVTIEKEVEYLTNYLDLQRLRLNDNVQLAVELNFDDPSDKLQPLLLLPFIENAFKYGVSAEKRSEISIQLSVVQKTLTLKVFNTKCSKDEPMNSTGIGQKITTQRLQLSYAEKHALDIKDEEDNYLVILLLKLV
jgi:Histidine kinase